MSRYGFYTTPFYFIMCNVVIRWCTSYSSRFLAYMLISNPSKRILCSVRFFVRYYHSKEQLYITKNKYHRTLALITKIAMFSKLFFSSSNTTQKHGHTMVKSDKYCQIKDLCKKVPHFVDVSDWAANVCQTQQDEMHQNRENKVSERAMARGPKASDKGTEMCRNMLWYHKISA